MENSQDKQLDIPAEANREKHINFREAEENAAGSNNNGDGQSQEDEERRRQWQKGLEEGRRAATKNNDQ